MTGIWIFAVLMLVPTWVVDGGAQAERPSLGAVTVDVNGPLVIGFFPPFTDAEQAADDGGIREGLAHVRFALEDIAKCYGNKAATYRLDITRSVILRDGTQVRRIDIPRDSGHAVGIVLALPGRPARTVFATAGPSTLVVLGPAAAGEYFAARNCREDQ